MILFSISDQDVTFGKHELQGMEKTYIISLAVLSTIVVLLLLLVFILLYFKIKQRHRASFSLSGGQDIYCKCPLVVGQSPPLTHKYTLNQDIANKFPYNPDIVQKYDQPFVDSSLKSDTNLDEQHAFLPTEKDKDFINEDTCETIESKCQFKDWSSA